MKPTSLPTLLSQAGLVRAVGAHNGLTARLVEEAGFDAIWASGLEISASYGLPDNSTLTMTELLHAAGQMVDASSLPVIADCDTGFGGPHNVAHAVARYEKQGVAAMCIEDKVFPKVNSFADAAQVLIPQEDFSRKLQAAKSAQRTSDFLVIARTEALVAGRSMTEALDRADAYRSAGADCILIHSRQQSPTEVLSFAQQWKCRTPLIAVPTTYNTVTEGVLVQNGFKVVIYANQAMRAAIKSVQSVLTLLNQGDTAAEVDELIAPIADIFALQRPLGRSSE